MGRSLFLHHYLPALLCSYLVTSVVFNFMFINSVEYPISIGGVGNNLSNSRPKVIHPVSKAGVDYISITVAVILICLSFGAYLHFAPLTYGTPGLDPYGVHRMRWLDTWDLHFQPKKGEFD